MDILHNKINEFIGGGSMAISLIDFEVFFFFFFFNIYIYRSMYILSKDKLKLGSLVIYYFQNLDLFFFFFSDGMRAMLD